MTYVLVWKLTAAAGLARIRAVDPAAVRTVRAAVSALTVEPRPDASRPLGTEGHRRLRIGPYRVLYQVDDGGGVITVLTVGRVAG